MTARTRAAAHAIAVAGLAGVFAYQGLVPKVWKTDASEVALWEAYGVSRPRATQIVRAVGAVEATFGLMTLARRNQRWPFVVALAAMPAVAIAATTTDRSLASKNFSPVSLGLAVVALAGVALATTREASPLRSRR
jgi:DoxX-like family